MELYLHSALPSWRVEEQLYLYVTYNEYPSVFKKSATFLRENKTIFVVMTLTLITYLPT
jgi:hypothetical protein